MIGKVGVEAAKKGVTMAGQKLGEFFTKEGLKQAGQQVGNVGKALYDNRAALASALGDDLTRAGAQVMKAPGAVKAGAQAVGEAASQATAQVGKEAVRTGIKLGGKAGGQGVTNVGKMMTSPFAIQTGIGVAAEQVVPRVMGLEPTSGLGESVLRQGVSQGVGMPVGAGLRAGGVNPTIAAFGGQVAGQVAGRQAAKMFYEPQRYEKIGEINQETGEYRDFGQGPTTPTGATKFTAEPEYNEVVRPSTRDLSNVQAQEALSERDKYEYRLKMAQIEKMPSTVMHMSPDSNNQTLASLAQSMMRQASY